MSAVHHHHHHHHIRLIKSCQLQTLHTLQVQASEKDSSVMVMSWRGRAGRSIRSMFGVDTTTLPTSLPTSLKTQVTICDMLHSRKMLFNTFIMCSLWSVLSPVSIQTQRKRLRLNGNRALRRRFYLPCVPCSQF